MHEEKRKKVIFPLLILLDQALKFFSLITGIGHVNQGASWGLFSFRSNIHLAFFSFLIIIFLCLFRKKAGVWLIIAGGISNLFDRFVRGGVVDFIKIPLIPTFNLADVAICLGTILFLVDYLKAKKLS